MLSLIRSPLHPAIKVARARITSTRMGWPPWWNVSVGAPEGDWVVQALRGLDGASCSPELVACRCSGSVRTK
jgi:hypothetical protein